MCRKSILGCAPRNGVPQEMESHISLKTTKAQNSSYNHITIAVTSHRLLLAEGKFPSLASAVENGLKILIFSKSTWKKS